MTSVWKSGSRSGAQWKVGGQTSLIFHKGRGNNGGGDNGKGIRQIFAHWVYVVQRKIYPEFASPNMEVFVNLRPFLEAARMAGAFAGDLHK